MILRDRQGKIPAELNERIKLAAAEPDIQELQLHDITLELMTESLNELNTEQQQCVTLFYLQKKSYQEISDSTGFTMMQVKSHIQNGKRNLKILIESKLKKQE